MQYSQSIGGIRVLASMPGEADIDFIQEALKYGLSLYNVGRFNPSDASFGPHNQYFGKSPTELFVGPNEYLVLFDNGGWLEANEKTFEALFKPIGAVEAPVAPPAKKLQGKKFYLDAGHGGSDPGAVNDNLGLEEKIAALDICLYLGEILEQQGALVYFSRIDNETYPALTHRATEANSYGADAFISIHLNSAENKAASGIETLVYSLNGTAAKIAEKVQQNMIKATGWKDRGVKARPDLGVLRLTKMPAILCEVGFISNDQEAKELFKKPTQQKLANAIAEGIISQFGD